MKRQSALILLDKPVTPDIDAIMEALHQRHPVIEANPFIECANHTASAVGMWLIKCAGKVAAVRYNPERVPEDEPLIVLSEWHWPQAREAYKRHQVNIHISTVEKDEDQLSLARVVTAIAGSVIDTVPGGLAVIYNDKVMQHAELWQKLSTLALAPTPRCPLELWVFLNPYNYEGGNLITTIGLSAFTGREIELEGGEDRNAAAQCAATTALFLLDNNAPVQDGDTITFPEKGQYKVHLQNSDRFERLPVYLIRHA